VPHGRRKERDLGRLSERHKLEQRVDRDEEREIDNGVEHCQRNRPANRKQWNRAP
jgi:hypothetical protein